MNRTAPVFEHVQGGNVPGGHNVLCSSKSGRPFITPMRECNSIELRHSDVVVDIGAYVGTYAIRCARFPVRHVRAFEPTPMTCDLLKLTPLPNLEVIQAAVVGHEVKPNGTVPLFVSKGIGVTNSLAKSHRKAGAIEVPAFWYWHAVDGATVVKIDVEGGEYDLPIVEAIEGIRAILIDFHPMPGDWVGRAESIIEGLEDHGFKALIAPDWSCGWTQAGSWIRPMSTDQSNVHEPMMSGRLCCGCGTEVVAGASKTLCSKCWDQWLPRHRKGFLHG